MIFTPDFIARILISYLLGSISGGMILGRLNGVDIRAMGSGNAGGTNAFRTMGAKFAAGVLLIDVVKGFIAVHFVPLLNLGELIPSSEVGVGFLPIACGCGAVLGHVYPVYFKFKGGKGAGTMVGVLLALFPTGLAVCLTVWGLGLILTGYVGFSTILGGIILPISTFFFYEEGLATPFGKFSIIICFFIIFTHRSNIIRMIQGTENRFEKAMIFQKKHKINQKDVKTADRMD